MDQVEVEGLRIAYARTGSGPPVALAHGFVADGLSTWASQIDALSSEFTVIAWDAPGAGQSASPPESFRAADYADCWASFLRALGFPRAHLVGLSSGAIVALALVERDPTMVSSLALVGGYAGWRGSLTEAEVDARLHTCLRVSELPPEEFARAMIPSMFSAAAAQTAVDGFAAAFDGSTRPGSAPWPGCQPRPTCVTCCPRSTCPPCCSTAIRTSARHFG